jgi:hypothetical protein
MKYKTEPYKHQLDALARLERRKAYALFMEQGTGKTKVVLDDCARLYAEGRLDCLVVAAPNGVHKNWVSREIPTHLPDWVEHVAWAWEGLKRKRDQEAYNALYAPGQVLRVLTLNLEALRTQAGYKAAEDLLKLTGSAMFVVDESTRIKNPKAAVTKACIKLGKLARFRRLCNGTEFLPPMHPLVRAIALKNRSRATPLVQAKDDEGRPVFKNLEELRGVTDAWGYRVRKDECLDLPEKIYKRWPVDLGPKHMTRLATYLAAMKTGATAEPMIVLQKMAAYQRLLHGWVPKQISGAEDHEPMFDRWQDNGRLKALVECVEDHPGKTIIWAKFKTDIQDIVQALGESRCVTYYGETKPKDRELAVDLFQHGTVQFFVGQPGAGGVGLTLHAAETVIYYSNTFRLYDRMQSEDRAHRIGQTKHVVYVDLEVPGTLDTRVIDLLRGKRDVADAVTGDPSSGWLDIAR